MNEKEIKQQLRDEIIARLDLSRQMDEMEVRDIIDQVILQHSKKYYLGLTYKERFRQELFNSIRRLDLLQTLIDDKSISEIMINGPNQIFIERNGKIEKWDKQFESRQKLEDVIQQVVSFSNRRINEASPIVDARLEDGSRVNIVLPPAAINGPIMTIRKFPEEAITIQQLIDWEAITLEAAQFLAKLVEAKYNIFISGGTGSGKTTFLNALSNFIPKDERIITIEDSAELQIQGLANLVKLEVRNANVEGNNEISIRDLIKTSLRMRPDRIIVGEVRGGEALDMLSAMNTGHDGSLSTGHSNSPSDMLSRIETMVLMANPLPLPAVRRQIASAIDIIIQLGRLRDKSRKVLEIVEVVGYDGENITLNTLYAFEEEDVEDRVIGGLREVGTLYHRSKLLRNHMHRGG